MTQSSKRLSPLIPPTLTTIGLVVILAVWLVVDDMTQSAIVAWLLLEIALMSGLIILSPGLFRRYHRKVYMVLTGLFIAALIIGWSAAWSPTKPFGHFYKGIHTGMTMPEVQQQLDQAFPPNGRHPKPKAENRERINGQTEQLFRLEPPLGAEIIIVHFDQGRVTKAEYSPD